MTITSVWADKKTCPTKSYDLYVFLLLASENEEPDEHFKLISKILQPCIETENAKNNSYFTILSNDPKAYDRNPISIFDNFTAVINSMHYQKTYWPSKEYLYGAMESFEMVESQNRSNFQKVIYLITDAKAQDVDRVDATFWQNLVSFANANTDPKITSIFRVIFTKTGLIEGTKTQLLLDSVSDAAKEYFRYDYGDLLKQPNVSDNYGLCAPLPPSSTLPSFPKFKEMSAVWIVLIALGGTFLFLFVAIVCMCTCCRRYCWCPDFGGINWTKNVGEQLRERIYDETERFTIQVRGKVN
ncbi:unnamed protein product, partial [Mesorhabditis belari]|uniref:Uncharacterized protein n=1 Tax=Mesorhabditis belari TaxID=2138241 RepID=A0AAF3EJZ6_9BILA